MKKIVWFVFLCCIMVGQPVWAQNRVTEQQKVEYDKGNRDQKFLKEYIEALKADGQTEILNDVVDEYLMVLPLNERYSGGNLSDFVEYITHMNTKTIVDIIENWDKISFTEEQADKIVEKMTLSLPKEIHNVVSCKNPRCISSIEQELEQVFVLTDPVKGIYRCKYCEEQYHRHKKSTK